MVLKVSELKRVVNKLDDGKYIVVEDDNGIEYIIDSISIRTQCCENNWYYVLKIKNMNGNGCLKR